MKEGITSLNVESGVKFIKGIDLINRVKDEPEPKFLWHGIPEGSKGMIAGVAKTGKTTLAENLAISMAVGRREFLGFELDPEPKRVLFINLEESYRLRGRRNLKQISQFSRVEKELFDENYLNSPYDFPEFLVSQEDWQKVRECVIASEAKVVFIDSITHMFEGKIEDSQAANKFVKKFRETFEDLEVTIVVVHHSIKGNDGPMEQHNIAGSRIIQQELEYAIGLSDIPTSTGGNYMCMLYNKHISKDSTTATLYKIDEFGWVQHVGVNNKYDLYKDKLDGRTSTTNRDVIYDYVKSQTSQDSQTIKATDLMNYFVEGDNSKMSKDTLYKNVNKLIGAGQLEKYGHGEYKLSFKENALQS